jgi:hypothetical protein
MSYQLITPWDTETWIADGTYATPYARLAGRPNPQGGRITDVGRGITLLVTGTTVTENRTPSQDDLADADVYYLGGHSYTLDDTAAQVLINAGYSEYLTQL